MAHTFSKTLPTVPNKSFSIFFFFFSTETKTSFSRLLIGKGKKYSEAATGVFYKKPALKHFAMYTGKTCVGDSF